MPWKQILQGIAGALLLSGLLALMANGVLVAIFGTHLRSTEEGSWVQHDFLVDQKARRRIRNGTLIVFLVALVLCLAIGITTGAFTVPAPTPTIGPTPEATSAPQATPPPRAVITYTVRAGDTLAKIAAEFGVTIEAIVEANDIEDPSLISVGQVLVIPKP